MSRTLPPRLRAREWARMKSPARASKHAGRTATGIEDSAALWIEHLDKLASMRWPDGPACPRCRGSSVQSGAAHPSMPYRYRGCGKRFSVRTGSVTADTKLGYRVRAVALFLLTTGLKGVSGMKLHRDPGISRKSAWHLAHRIRACRERDRDLFVGPVEVDETCVGGKERNKHESKKARGGRAGPRHERSGRPAAAGHDRGRPAGLRARPGRAGRAGPLRRGGGLRRHGGVPARGRQALRRRVRARGGACERHRVVPAPVQARPLRNLSPDERPSFGPLPHGVRGTAQRPQLRHGATDAAHGAGLGRPDADLPAAGRQGRGRGPSTAWPVRCGLSSRSVRRALRIRNPAPRPVSSPDNSYRQPPWKGSLSTAIRVRPGRPRRPLQSLRREIRLQARFRYEPTLRCPPRPHTNDPSKTAMSPIRAVLAGHDVAGTQIYNSHISHIY